LRFLFALVESLKARKKLQLILKSNTRVFKSVLDIDVDAFQRLNINVLVLDFDGVLASHGEQLPFKESVTWLQDLQRARPSMPIFIFSNKPMPDRISFFSKNFANIEFLQNFPKKPYPDGLRHVANKTGVNISQVGLVDDRVLTGLLATVLAGCQAIYISQPFISFKKRPIKEVFFELLRKIEILVFK